jgi:hypothetical protein
MVNQFKVKFGIIIVMLVMVIAGGACGPNEQATPEQTPPEQTEPVPSKPGSNQPPEISSISPAQTQVQPSSIVEVRCDASDPDGDALTFDWSSTGGTFSGTGNMVSWVAPEQYGSWDIIVTVKDGKGNVTQASVTLDVVKNQDPAISSLAADPITVLPQSRSTVTCTASDPDGDALTYSWEASAGEITGVGKTVTWIAPDREGWFTITVTVDDDRGGLSVSTISVAAERAVATETFTPVANETGTVTSDRDRDTSRTIAGDSEANEGYRAFWSFDLYSLRGTDVREAKLTFTTKKVVGDPGPFAKGSDGLHGLYIWRIYSEPGQLPEYSASDPREKELAPLMWEAPEVIDVTEEVGRIAGGLSPSDRFQVRAGFQSKTNGTSTTQYIEWHSVTITVTYVRK